MARCSKDSCYLIALDEDCSAPVWFRRAARLLGVYDN